MQMMEPDAADAGGSPVMQIELYAGTSGGAMGLLGLLVLGSLDLPNQPI